MSDIAAGHNTFSFNDAAIVRRNCLAAREMGRTSLVIFGDFLESRVPYLEHSKRSSDETVASLEQQVATLNERHRLLVQTMLHGVVRDSADGLIIEMNAAAERILGENASKLVGSSS